MRTAVVVGASTGIDEATMNELARRGWRVFATVRHQDADVRKFAGLKNVTPLLCDVRDKKVRLLSDGGCSYTSWLVCLTNSRLCPTVRVRCRRQRVVAAGRLHTCLACCKRRRVSSVRSVPN